MRLFYCFFIILPLLPTSTWRSVPGQNAKGQSAELINIPELPHEAETRSCQILREREFQFENYTFKTRRVTREMERDGKVKEESEPHIREEQSSRDR
jgi:hypothetical protein